MMLRKVSQIFIKGLLTILPIAITITLLIWLINLFEFIFGSVLKSLMPYGWYHFGMGLVLGLLVIFIIGFSVQLWLGKKLFSFFETIVLHIPVIKSLYRPIKHIQHILTQQKKEQGQPVLFKIREGVEMIGVVMNEDASKPLHLKDENKVAVLLFWSYQMGGFTVFVDKEFIRPLDIPLEKAFKLAFTAGIEVKD